MTLSGGDKQLENFLLIKEQLEGSPFPLRRTAWQAAPTDRLKMSVPVAPKKSYYTQLRDNRNGAKNNNESILSLGDTNANQIMLEVSSSRDESETCDLRDEIGNANTSEPENGTHFHKEFHQLQGFGKGSIWHIGDPH